MLLLRKVLSSIRMHLMYSPNAGSSHRSFTHVLARADYRTAQQDVGDNDQLYFVCYVCL